MEILSMKKIWKRLVYPGIEPDNRFLISSDGDLMNELTGKILKPEILRSGYYSVRVTLGSRTKKKHVIIHKAVAYTFLDNPNGYKVINHKNGKKKKNNVDNLEWSIYKDNLQHAYDTGLFDKSKISGENNHAAKLTWSNVKEIRERYSRGTATLRSLAKEYGVSEPVIHDVIKNTIWKDSTYTPPKSKK